MKTRLLLVVFAITLVFASCATQSVSRVDSSKQIDLSGYWNDTDLKLVCETLINDCLTSPRVQQASAKKRDLPVIIVGSFRNDSDEHIDTSIITKRMESAILNSGKADFVASKFERAEIRDERTEQQGWASEETAKALANETGADFILTGSVKTIVDKAGKTAVRTYFVYGELTDLETNKKIWIGENSGIKKVIKTAGAKF